MLLRLLLKKEETGKDVVQSIAILIIYMIDQVNGYISSLLKESICSFVKLIIPRFGKGVAGGVDDGVA